MKRKNISISLVVGFTLALASHHVAFAEAITKHDAKYPRLSYSGHENSIFHSKAPSESGILSEYYATVDESPSTVIEMKAKPDAMNRGNSDNKLIRYNASEILVN